MGLDEDLCPVSVRALTPAGVMPTRLSLSFTFLGYSDDHVSSLGELFILSHFDGWDEIPSHPLILLRQQKATAFRKLPEKEVAAEAASTKSNTGRLQ